MATGGVGSGPPPKPAKDDEEEVEEVQNDPEYELDAATAAQLMAAAGGSKGLINALKARLDGMVGAKSGFIETLPAAIQHRIAFLEKLQEQHDELEDKFREEQEALEAKYRQLYEPLYARREKIVTGSEEAPPPEDDQPPATAEEQDVPKGIPQFWLNVLRNHPAISEMITEKDEPVLEHLINVTAATLAKEDEKGFRLTFTFAANPFFTNEKLTKTYVMVDEDEPILERAEGTEINWNTGKNPTVKVLKKKAKKGGRGGKGAQTKIEPCASFFNFFSPPAVPDEEEELEEEELEELQSALEEDYDIGETIKDRLIPHAVSWYTGDAIDQEEGEEAYDEDDEEEGDDEDDDDDDDDAEGELEALKDAKEQPPECKQQ